MDYINGNDLYQMFNYGTVNILQQRKVLNEINVFPVSDRDTGNNLASTLQAISQKSIRDDSFHLALQSISESALYGARGNSGVIFAQFVNGLMSASKGKARVTIEEFAEMVNQSVVYTYSSLSNPVEGTMLTVIKDWANSLIAVVKKNIESIKLVFEHAFSIAKKSLEKTKEQLQILKKNDVVDSGAMGFVLFLQGINSYYNNEAIESVNYEEIEIEHKDTHDENVSFRYCTEGLVKTNETLLEANLKDVLNKYGDSLIVAKGLNMFRIHIHTDSPELVFSELRKYGKIITQKVDNMIQDIALEKPDNKTVIVTDSICDLDIEFINKNNIVVVPINVKVDEVDYFDKLTINNEILFDLIPNISEYPTTATPTIKYVDDLFVRLLKQHDQILVLTVSGNLSATHNVLFEQAKKAAKPGKRIHVIDTLNNSATEGLLVRKAVDLLASGLSLDEVIEYIEIQKKKTKILVCLNTFKYAAMSGRLPKVVGKIGNFFGMRPIMTLDQNGKGAAFGIGFSKKAITKKIIKLINKEITNGGIEEYSLVHCLNSDLADEYSKLFTKIIGKEPEYIADVSSATAIHSGVGTVAIGYIRK
ncbi:DegV family protein [Mycoplasmatota bacterium WC30]